MTFRTILFWLFVAYVGVIVVWRLFVSVLLVVGSYAEEGLKGAVATALIAFVVSVWDMLKFVVSLAITVLLISLFFRACS